MNNQNQRHQEKRVAIPVQTEPTTEPVQIEPEQTDQPTKTRELLKRNYVKTVPAPSSEALELLKYLYYKEMLIFGRDKLVKYILENHADIKVSRRQIADWLKLQETNQINTRHKTSKDIKATVVKKYINNWRWIL